MVLPALVFWSTKIRFPGDTGCAMHTQILTQDWVKCEAPTLRCVLVHSLPLRKRSESSRSAKVRFLKQFMHKLLSSEGKHAVLRGCGCASFFNF